MCVLKSNRCKNSHVVYNKGIKTPKSTMKAIASEHTKNLGKNLFKPFTDNRGLHAYFDGHDCCWEIANAVQLALG